MKKMLAVAALFAVVWSYERWTRVEPAGSVADPAALAGSFEERSPPDTAAEPRAGSQFESGGTVIRVLSDDNEGSRHQRFIVRLGSGRTVLIAHNIDIASRVEDLEAGDIVSFSGEFADNDKGGVVHWTHHDPNGRHVAGWIRHRGRTYQ